MIDTQVLNNQKNRDTINLNTSQHSTDTQLVVMQTSDKRLAKQLADHYLALAQAYRQIAGMEPIATIQQRRKAAWK